jgi:predicted transposase YdaD
VYKFPKLSREEIQQMLGYSDISLKETRFYQDVYAEGQQEGEQKGQQEGEAKLILRQLTRRFGTLGDGTQNRIKHLNITQLEALGDALLDFSIQEDVDRWLDK